MEQKTPHIVYTERISPKRRLIRSDGALYVVLLLGAFLAIFLSRVLAQRFGVLQIFVQIGLYAVLLGTGYWIYRTRLVDYLYELYDAELRVLQVVGAKQKTLLSIPLRAVEEVAPYRKTDARKAVRTFHGARESTVAVWYTEDGERYVACLNASDTMKEKLSEAAHAAK